MLELSPDLLNPEGLFLLHSSVLKVNAHGLGDLMAVWPSDVTKHVGSSVNWGVGWAWGRIFSIQQTVFPSPAAVMTTDLDGTGPISLLLPESSSESGQPSPRPRVWEQLRGQERRRQPHLHPPSS